ncbi:hypothetical protein [Streptomyces pluripotens]|uniref:hypothetical protein n=1 Tax=Streptomyces pluripotens TaxID=1355015 RepID=UPI000AFD4F37|nr:hypothetical protein [Streptomyces pluripotens]
MNKPRKKIRIVGERRPELDVARFAEALIAFAMHRLKTSTDKNTAEHDQPAAVEQERAS